jgi:hypothetical protein
MISSNEMITPSENEHVVIQPDEKINFITAAGSELPHKPSDHGMKTEPSCRNILICIYLQHLVRLLRNRPKIKKYVCQKTFASFLFPNGKGFQLRLQETAKKPTPQSYPGSLSLTQPSNMIRSHYRKALLSYSPKRFSLYLYYYLR